MAKGGDQGFTTVDQTVYNVPDIPIKELLGAIPQHCFKRSALKGSVYIFYDLAVIFASYKGAVYLDSLVPTLDLSSPYAYTALRVVIWAFYTIFAGLFGTGIWVIGHECGHQAFSESKTINSIVGWVLHSAVGVPYFSWKITHAKHHASTGHLTQDQVFVPHSRSAVGVPPFNPEGENLLGSRVSDSVKAELWEALGDSPISAMVGSAKYLLGGWPAYITLNASGQKRYPKGTNHFNPSSPMFAPHQRSQVVMSTVGMMLWAAGILASMAHWGFSTVLVVYLIPYLWINHWLVLITFLQHTDPLLPHYRASEFTFTRGALATFDRSLLGDLGPFMAWLGAHATNGISETHVLHHVCSKIPHYNAWEASDALKKVVHRYGVPTEGNPGSWREVYRVYQQCKFVEDEGDVVMYKNAEGLAIARAQLPEAAASDSGVEIEK